LNGSVRRRKSGRRASEKSEGQAQAKARSKLIDTEDAASGAVPWSVYIAYFRSMGYWFAIFAVLCNIAQQAASVYSSSKFSFGNLPGTVFNFITRQFGSLTGRLI